jgi:hypothetical protein
MTSLPSSERQLGPAFCVTPAKDWFGPDAQGFVVQHRATQWCVWTGGFMSLSRAADVLIAALSAEAFDLRTQIKVAAQWCGDGCCEFKKLKFEAPPVEDFDKNFLKYVEGQG